MVDSAEVIEMDEVKMVAEVEVLEMVQLVKWLSSL